MRNKWEKVKAKVKLVLMVDDDDDQAPSEQDIEDALKILVSRKPELLEDSEGYNRTFRELRNELVPKIDEGITLTDQNSAWKHGCQICSHLILGKPLDQIRTISTSSWIRIPAIRLSTIPPMR